MKFKEKRGNVFVFKGGYEREEFELIQDGYGFFNFKDVTITDKQGEFCIARNGTYGFISYQDIQTAVCMMQILIEEGLV